MSKRHELSFTTLVVPQVGFVCFYSMPFLLYVAELVHVHVSLHARLRDRSIHYSSGFS